MTLDYQYIILDINFNMQLSYRREIALQGELFLAKSGGLELGDVTVCSYDTVKLFFFYCYHCRVNDVSVFHWSSLTVLPVFQDVTFWLIVTHVIDTRRTDNQLI